jgi:hypothetical protein
MKNLHKINFIRDRIPDWVKSWAWWAQTMWNNAYNITVSETSIHFIHKQVGLKDFRDKKNSAVFGAWIKKGKPEPDWSEIKYE